ncbi:cadmium efflux system accessory family protein [Gemella bergeri ATCC 700627]|uniref:Cadmium efflux system accessory family protein n=1 Tax=Gemella bergeri ATCC 700627 TaxID=1321820 RepID=U2QBG9_9BACL|nr:metalloregulator ArsR/SmtB family transcription factor [Gemella bergeri]ERK60195.1 cadmium efflux system accessory family protein [Gemella bergeri ATCC 700627]
MNLEERDKVYNFLNLIADKRRIDIIYLIMKKRLCVQDIAEIINETVANTSYHLQQLKKGNIVKVEKEGKEVFYSLSDKHVYEILENVLEHISHK